jgi:hypothetical protein
LDFDINLSSFSFFNIFEFFSLLPFEFFKLCLSNKFLLLKELFDDRFELISEFVLLELFNEFFC